MTTLAWATGQRDEVIARIARHRAADEIVQGTGFRDGRGCAIGCSLDEYSHAEYCRVILGEGRRQMQLAALIDRLHEDLPRKISVAWPGRVATAIREGADLSLVVPRWLHWLLTVELSAYPVCAPVAALLAREIAGDPPTTDAWVAAEAARAAGAAEAAAGAAWAAGAAGAAGAAARAGSYRRQADALVAILEAP